MTEPRIAEKNFKLKILFLEVLTLTRTVVKDVGGKDKDPVDDRSRAGAVDAISEKDIDHKGGHYTDVKEVNEQQCKALPLALELDNLSKVGTGEDH